MAHGPKRIEKDESGRIYHVYLDEQVDADSDLAVQLLNDGELQTDEERGNQNVVILDPEDELAVQVLEEDEHPLRFHERPSPNEAYELEEAERAESESEDEKDSDE